MNSKTAIRSLWVCGLLAAGLTACRTEMESREGETKTAPLEAQAKVSRPQAESIALAKVPGGVIKEGELEKERRRLVWSFDIATSGTTDITEVQVDALTGSVVSVDHETTAEQEKERQAHARQKAGEKEEKD
jgi:hypothetical protein